MRKISSLIFTEARRLFGHLFYNLIVEEHMGLFIRVNCEGKCELTRSAFFFKSAVFVVFI